MVVEQMSRNGAAIDVSQGAVSRSQAHPCGMALPPLMWAGRGSSQGESKCESSLFLWQWPPEIEALVSQARVSRVMLDPAKLHQNETTLACGWLKTVES